jgi:aquaporin Z
MLISMRTARPAPKWTTRLLSEHWPEYAIEGVGIAIFMICACASGTVLGHPDSPVKRFIQKPTLLRMVMGFAIGITAAALIYSKFGKRSGAHFNPSTTLTFFRLGKLQSADAFLYIAAQFAGAIIGVSLAAVVLGKWLADPAVNYVATVPGAYGYRWAFFAETVITFLLMSVVLRVSNTPTLNRYTGLFAALLVMIYIIIEAPISGMSMNPARTLGSAFMAGKWTDIWIYFTAPPLGMLSAAEVYVRSQGAERVLCAKLHHENRQRCIFRCSYPSS